MTYYSLLILFILQRLSEVARGNRNLEKNIHNLVSPLNESEKKQMLLMHASWFGSCFLEYAWHGQMVSPLTFFLGILILIVGQYVRFITMKLFGDHWTHFPVAFKNQKIVNDGPYRLIKHPNYLVVIIEIALVPMIGGCYWTAIIFSIANFIFLLRRMTIEEEALEKCPEYGRLKMKKKLIPFLFSLLFIVHAANAETLKFHSKDYNEAKKAPTYFMFEGESSKFGMITTSFDGYAKSGELQYEQKEGLLSNILLKLDANKIDTDNDSRNEKMQEVCLETSKYPEIKIEIKALLLTVPTQTVDGIMTVRDQKVPLKIEIRKQDEKTFKGETSFKLTEAHIPDPSIAIASVKDKFKINFQVRLP